MAASARKGRAQWKGRGAVLLAVWGAAMAGVLLSWRITKAGPVLLLVTARHGVHAGDIAALCLGCGVAIVVTGLLLRRWFRLDDDAVASLGSHSEGRP
jgi:hypothetical protein